MADDSCVSEIRNFLNAHKSMNEGHGLIVPPALAEKLKEMGITEGYSVQRMLPYEK